jgi:LysM repeat protein
MMKLAKYRPRHLKPKPKKHGPVVVGAAAAVALSSQCTALACTYRVRPGDTLSGIAHSHHTTVSALARRNHIADPNTIYVGRALKVPGDGSGGSSVHIVQPGETLSSIAARYGTTVVAIAHANDIPDPNMIVTGARLRVGGSASSGTASVPAPARTHVVLAGETLSDIAARYGTSIDSIANANHLSDANLIVIGQTLEIPAGGSGDVEYLLESEAVAHGVETSLVKAVAWQESGWNQSARSSVGAIGIMQVMPDTARYINNSLGTGNLHVRRAADNVKLGVTYLRHVLDLTGSESKGLAAYYSGPGNVGRRLKSYQRPYVRAVQALKARFR